MALQDLKFVQKDELVARVTEVLGAKSKASVERRINDASILVPAIMAVLKEGEKAHYGEYITIGLDSLPDRVRRKPPSQEEILVKACQKPLLKPTLAFGHILDDLFEEVEVEEEDSSQEDNGKTE